ncbi:MAG: beta-lactamase family protein [Candidatus Eremiobacteraeota bacterium]|nr:beta-lactamase family protein [Candidatus Eremiobacteraeota bacterium]
MVRAACGTIFTGAVARVEHQGRLVYERAYGRTRDDVLARPVYRDTLFDLASITKIFVATRALELVQRGVLTLDGLLVRWIPEWANTDHEPITLRMLLAHISGMNSGADYRQLLGTNVVEFAIARDLVQAPGESVIYSDLGFIALGALLERIEGIALQQMIPGYLPRSRQRPAIPATEDDGWRGRVQGFVHDEKAFLMGGTAGHAGIFGTAADVAALGERYLATFHGRQTTLDPDMVRAATSEQADDAVLRRGLGWALKTSNENSCGRWFSKNSFGHTGFVGTCIWVDPERDVSAVLLTNSVYYGRNDTRDLRAAFYEAVVDDLGLR